MTTTRLIELEDAEELHALLEANRDFLAPFEPAHPAHETVDDQRRIIEIRRREHADGVTVPHVILDDGRIVGRITLSTIVRFAFQSGNLGYWVAQADNSRGHASAATARLCELAFGELGLHRVEAGTLPGNVRSQRVLEHNGFVRFGLAPHYLRIAGRWQDHVLFQKLSEDPADGS